MTFAVGLYHGREGSITHPVAPCRPVTLCTSASSLACACSLLLLDRLHPLFLFDPADQMAHTGAMFERPGKLSDYIKSPYVVSIQANA